MDEDIKRVVRERYGEIALQGISRCGSINNVKGEQTSPCCGSSITYEKEGIRKVIGKSIGYEDEDLKSVPEGANLGLGCGNPIALASVKEGDVVLDLGSGAGFDCFLAANRVGERGRVIGVDMTPEMISKARENTQKGGYNNVEFRLGEIEHLPVADESVDIVISNCVINLSPDKESVFQEAFRALKPGGRLIISDIVLLKELPDRIKSSVDYYVGCVAGAMAKDAYLKNIKTAGFQDVDIIETKKFPIELVFSDQMAFAISKELKLTPEEFTDIVNSVQSITVYGLKPS